MSPHALDSRSGEGVSRSYDPEAVRADFPALHQEIHGHPLVYLDSAASAQKPEAVLHAMDRLYREDYANVHRGVHTLSERSTRAYEGARDRIREFVGAEDSKQLVFVRGTTEAVNLVAQSFVRPRLSEGDVILLTELEHHSNIVPWQLVAGQTGARIEVVPIEDDGSVPLESFTSRLNDSVKFASFSHVSNALGTVLPVVEMVAAARAAGVPTMIDGAQATPHLPVDVTEIGADFYAFSGHKLYGPSGIGVLYGREELLESMAPYQGGGEMIRHVSFNGTEFNELPHKFEAGTPDIAGAVGLGAAVDYVAGFNFAELIDHEHALLEAATEGLRALGGITLYGTAEKKSAVVSFAIDEVHPHDIGTILDREGVAVRAGHHCAQPVMERYGVPATARASFGIYNTLADVERFLAAVGRCQAMFR